MTKTYKTIRVRFEDDVWFIQIHRPEANNAINDCLIEELSEVISLCQDSAKIIVLEGMPDVFCFGADFKEIQKTSRIITCTSNKIRNLSTICGYN